MKILVACEFTGIVRDAFRAKGHDAWSCDLIPCEGDSLYHFEEDVLELLDEGWDMMIAHPPCTYLASSGLHWNKRRPERARLTEHALEFVSILLEASIERIALENPVGCISSRIRPPDQYIQPYEFGENASKKTGFWLKGLPKLVPTLRVYPRCLKCGRVATDTRDVQCCSSTMRYGNQLICGRDNYTNKDTRAMDRSRTYPGIAAAMASQWSFCV